MQTDTPSYKYYSDIVSLPLKTYIEVAVEERYSALIISGEPPEELLKSAWLSIQEQYADTMGNMEYQHYMNQLKEIASLNIGFEMIQMAVQQLAIILPLHFQHKEDPDFKQMADGYTTSLNGLVSKEYDFFQPDTYESLLKDCLTRSKGKRLEIRAKEAAMEASRQKHEEGENWMPNKEYYYSLLISISDHARIHLTDSISVYEFCDRFRRMQSDARRLEGMKKRR